MLIEELQLEIELISSEMEAVLNKFNYELNKIRTGRANPLMLESIAVDYYGSLTPVNQIAAINVVEGRQLIIKPYDPSVVKQILGAIKKNNLQVTTQDQGDYIRIIVPPLTEQVRKDLIRQVKKVAEEMRIRIRNLRRDINETIKKTKLSVDVIKSYQEDIQKLTDDYISKIDDISKNKEQDLMII